MNRWGTLNVVKTARAKDLGLKLRLLREKAEVKPDEAVEKLEWSRSKLYRIESGTTLIKQGELTAALDLYDADFETRASLEGLRKEVRTGRRGWWVGFNDVFQSSLPAFEHTARRIRVFEDTLIPGLFQTPDYAREVLAAMRPEDSPESIDRRVQARMTRQAVVARQDPPDIHVIIDEAALLRRVGSDAVMDAQLSALWAASRRPNVMLQILPFAGGAHAGMDGPFMILTFDEPDFPEVGFVEGQGGDVYLEGAVDLARISLTWDRLAMAALSLEDSARRCAELTKGE